MRTRRDTGVGVKATAAIMVVVGMSLWGGTAHGAVEKGARSVERSRYLLLDSRVVGNTENAILTVGTVQKSKHNPLFAEDKPWEPRFDNLYANVLYDEDENLYKCWFELKGAKLYSFGFDLIGTTR